MYTNAPDLTRFYWNDTIVLMLETAVVSTSRENLHLAVELKNYCHVNTNSRGTELGSEPPHI